MSYVPPQQRPRFRRIKDAAQHAAVSRARFYQWMHAHPELVRKDGRSSLIDMDALDRFLDALPIGLRAGEDD
jgi:hypothetical protein